MPPMPLRKPTENSFLVHRSTYFFNLKMLQILQKQLSLKHVIIQELFIAPSFLTLTALRSEVASPAFTPYNQ